MSELDDLKLRLQVSSFDDLLESGLQDPEVKAAYEAAQKHSDYHKDHPDQCPHYSIVAPIVDGQGDQPGECLDCHASPVMERETDCPLCYAEGQ